MKVFPIISLVFLVICLFRMGATKSAKITTKNKKFTTLKASSSKQVKVEASSSSEQQGGGGGGGILVGTINTGSTGGCTTQQVCSTVQTPRGPAQSCKDVLVCP